MWFNLFYLIIALFIIFMILLYVFKPSWVQTRNCVTGQCTVDFVYASILSFVFSALIGILAMGIAQSVLENRVNTIKAQAQQAIAEVRAEAATIGTQIREEFRTLKAETDVLSKDLRDLVTTVRTNPNVQRLGRGLASNAADVVENLATTIRRAATPRR